MTATVIAERICAAIASGLLEPVVEKYAFEEISTMSDLLRPWGAIYLGVEPPELEDDPEKFASRRGHKLLKPSFIGKPQRSPRPLPAPRRIASTPKLIHPDLFRSVSAVWSWYEEKGYAAAHLTGLPFNLEGMRKFTEPLLDDLNQYYMLGIDIDNIGGFNFVSDLQCLELRLPQISYDDPGAGVQQAFLEGAQGLQWLMPHCMENNDDWGLPASDLKIIGEIGWFHLAETYQKAPGKKTYDLAALEDVEETFFKEVKATYPDRFDQGIILIDDGWGESVPIGCKEDIEFGIAFATAWEEMYNNLPHGEDFENNSCGMTANFAHELCSVWRRANGKRQVKWSSSSCLLVNV